MSFTAYKSIGNGTLSSDILQNLDPTCNYQFKMTATNADGTSGDSNTVQWGASHSLTFPVWAPSNCGILYEDVPSYSSDLDAGVWVGATERIAGVYHFYIKHYDLNWNGSGDPLEVFELPLATMCSFPPSYGKVTLFPIHLNNTEEQGFLLSYVPHINPTEIPFYLFAFYKVNDTWGFINLTPPSDPKITDAIAMTDGLLLYTTDGVTWYGVPPSNHLWRISQASYDFTTSPLITLHTSPTPMGLNQYPLIIGRSRVGQQYQIQILREDYAINGGVTVTTLNSGSPNLGLNYSVDPYVNPPWPCRVSPLENQWNVFKIRKLDPVSQTALFQFHDVTTTATPLHFVVAPGGTSPSGTSLTTTVFYHPHEGDLTGASPGGFYTLQSVTQGDWLPNLVFSGAYEWGDTTSVRWKLECIASDGLTGKRYYCDLPVGLSPQTSNWILYETIAGGTITTVADAHWPADTSLAHYYPVIYLDQRVEVVSDGSVTSPDGQYFQIHLTPGSYYLRVNAAPNPTSFAVSTTTGSIVYNVGSHPDSSMAFQVGADAYYFIKSSGEGAIFDVSPFPTTEMMGVYDTDNGVTSNVTGWTSMFPIREHLYICGTTLVPNIASAPGTPTLTNGSYVNTHVMDQTKNTGFTGDFSDVGSNQLQFSHGNLVTYSYASPLPVGLDLNLLDAPYALDSKVVVLGSHTGITVTCSYIWHMGWGSTNIE